MDPKGKGVDLPDHVKRLFWETDAESVNLLEENADYVIERVLEYGDWEAVQFVRQSLGDEKIRRYIIRRGHKVLSKKTLSFWKFMLNLESEECLKPSFLRSSRQLWNY